MPELAVTRISPHQTQNRMIEYGCHESQFGAVLLAVQDNKLCNLFFSEKSHESFTQTTAEALLHKSWPQVQLVLDSQATRASFNQIFGSPTPDQPLSLLLRGTEFQQQVWQALLSIPLGKTSTYLAIATAIGRPTATRAVGTAIGKNPISFVIPCHRVIRQSGALGGYRWGLECKQQILAWEARQINPN